MRVVKVMCWSSEDTRQEILAMVHVPPQTLHEKVCVYSHLLVDADIKNSTEWGAKRMGTMHGQACTKSGPTTIG